MYCDKCNSKLTVIESKTTKEILKYKVEKYLVYLIDMLCTVEIIDKDTLLKYMPWSKEIHEDVRLQNKNIYNKKD